MEDKIRSRNHARIRYVDQIIHLGTQIIKSSAKGRICLFGEHQDYLGLPVITCTIDRRIEIKGQENLSKQFNIHLPDIDQHRQIDLSAADREPEARDYFASAIKVLTRSGINIDHGHDVVVQGNIPINSGLSSSSALCLAWIRYLIKAFSDQEFSPSQIGYWAYEAEVLEHGEPGGMMDQFAIAHEGLVHIQTTVPYEVKQLAGSIPELVVADSGQEKSTLDVLKKAKEGGLLALEHIKKLFPNEAVSELTFDHINALSKRIPSSVLPYLKATIGNYEITRRAHDLLQQNAPHEQALGQLMNQHQELLRNDLKVSTPELDNLVDKACSAGALGAKLVGSGGGGCIVAITPGRTNEVIEALDAEGAKEVFQAN
ncbi:MAG: galactokinase [Flavobacteriales bacterium]|nr:galactokinase [Flavobacteriales bacterium]NNK80948.1 galactokinase [Flavobacteriales bacterium]